MTDVQPSATSPDEEPESPINSDAAAEPTLSVAHNLDSAAADFARLPPDAPREFAAFPVSDDIKAAIAEMGFTKPTPVQCGVVLPALAGRDVVVQSKTGSGKTSAFGIPLMERLTAGKGQAGLPLALVVVPTRELAHQVAAELRVLASKLGTRVLAVYGGVPMGRQIAVLKAGVDVIVGTPGRLLDHVRRKNLSLSQLEVFILDEADEMLSMGFWDDVTAMLGMAPKERQTMMFSATLPYEVAKAAAQFQKDAVRVDLSGDKLSVAGIENHIYHVIPEMPKPRQLLYALEDEQPESAIIFCNTRNETEMIAKFLTTSGFIAEPLSGNLKQKERERVMGRIKARELRYMVATDIAARGIDITDLSHVFNYSLPEFSEVFLHRVGRTGRAGKSGTAVSLVDGMGLGTLTKLERDFGVHFTEKKLPLEEEAIRLRSARVMKDLAEKASVAEVGQHMAIAQEIVGGADSAQIVAYLLKSYFGTQAADAERRSRNAQNDKEQGRERDGGGGGGGGGRRERGERSERSEGGGERPERTVSTVGVGTAERAPRVEGQAEGEGGRRRRRRRRGRGRGERSDNGTFMETLDAAELLARDAAAESGEGGASASANGSQGLAHAAPSATAPIADNVDDGMKRMRVNIGFDDGFKGRGAVAKKIASLAGLNEGIVLEVESRRDHSLLKASPEIAELVVERVDGATIGKQVVSIGFHERG